MASRRIGGAGGGSAPGSGKSSGGGAVLAISVAVAVSVGGVTATGTATLTSSTSSASSSTSGTRNTSETRTKSRGSSQDAQTVEERLVRQGFRASLKDISYDSDCVGHSYGQVQNFFRQHPCVALFRAWLEVQDRQGDAVLVAVSWVQMPDEESAGALKNLVDAPGTGNVTELSREKGGYKSVRYTGEFYTSALDTSGTAFVNVQAQPVVRGTAGLALTSIVTNALP